MKLNIFKLSTQFLAVGCAKLSISLQSKRENFSSPHFSILDPPQKKLKVEQKPSTIVCGNEVSGNIGHRNGSFSVGNSTQKHALKEDTANSTNSSTNAKSSPPPQTQITKDDKPKDDQKIVRISHNQVSRNRGDHYGSFSVGNNTQEHALKKDEANSSNSSTSAKLSPLSQAQITKDDKPEDDRKPCIVVSGYKINDNEP